MPDSLLMGLAFINLIYSSHCYKISIANTFYLPCINRPVLYKSVAWEFKLKYVLINLNNSVWNWVEELQQTRINRFLLNRGAENRTSGIFGGHFKSRHWISYLNIGFQCGLKILFKNLMVQNIFCKHLDTS